MGKPVYWARILVVLINIPAVLIALRGYALLDIFLGVNIITTAFLMPLVWGLWDYRMSGTTLLWSGWLGALSSAVFSAIHRGGVVPGLQWMFSSEACQYDYRIFLSGFVGSIVSVCSGLLTIDRNRVGKKMVEEGQGGQKYDTNSGTSGSIEALDHRPGSPLHDGGDVAFTEEGSRPPVTLYTMISC